MNNLSFQAAEVANAKIIVSLMGDKINATHRSLFNKSIKQKSSLGKYLSKNFYSLDRELFRLNQIFLSYLFEHFDNDPHFDQEGFLQINLSHSQLDLLSISPIILIQAENNIISKLFKMKLYTETFRPLNSFLHQDRVLSPTEKKIGKRRLYWSNKHILMTKPYVEFYGYLEKYNSGEWGFFLREMDPIEVHSRMENTDGSLIRAKSKDMYLGAYFNKDKRDSLIVDWCEHLKRAGIKYLFLNEIDRNHICVIETKSTEDEILRFTKTSRF